MNEIRAEVIWRWQYKIWSMPTTAGPAVGSVSVEVYLDESFGTEISRVRIEGPTPFGLEAVSILERWLDQEVSWAKNPFVPALAATDPNRVAVVSRSVAVGMGMRECSIRYVMKQGDELARHLRRSFARAIESNTFHGTAADADVEEV